MIQNCCSDFFHSLHHCCSYSGTSSPPRVSSAPFVCSHTRHHTKGWLEGILCLKVRAFQRPAAPGCLPAREPYPHPSPSGPCLSALLLLMLSSAPWTLTLGDRSRACEGAPPSCASQGPSFIAHPPSATLTSYGGRSVLVQRMGRAGESDNPAFPGPILLLTPPCSAVRHPSRFPFTPFSLNKSCL